MGRLLITAIVLALALPAAATDVEDLVDRALRGHPSLDALEARLQAVEHRAVRAGTFPEPMLGFEYANMPLQAPYPGNHAMSAVQLRLQQTVLAPGTARARRDAVAGQSGVAGAAVDEARVALAASVRGAYWELARVRQLRGVTEAHLERVDQLIETVRASYEVGRAGQHDLLGLQVLRDRLDDDRYDFDRAEREWLAALEAAVHHDRSTGGALVVESPGTLEVPAAPTEESLEQLVQRAAGDHPSIRRWSALASVERAAADAARREALPDLTLWAGYRIRAPVGAVDAGDNQMTLGVSVPLPTSAANRWGRAASEHEVLARAAEAEAMADRDEIRAGLTASQARWERATGKATRYRDELIPSAESALDSTLSAYQVDRADFASLYRAEVQLLDLERAARNAEVDAQRAQVEVWMWLGRAGDPAAGDSVEGGAP
jgi:outer membrane protein, heavy metal efflux system